MWEAETLICHTGVNTLAYLTVLQPFWLLAGLVMLDGYVFAVGGWEGRSRLDSVECYNPHTNTWQFMESVKMAVTSPAVVALDGLLYVTGSIYTNVHWSQRGKNVFDSGTKL